MFITILSYENVDDYDVFRLENVLALKFTWAKCFFNHLTKVK
jgi:hypothetical protein